MKKCIILFLLFFCTVSDLFADKVFDSKADSSASIGTTWKRTNLSSVGCLGDVSSAGLTEVDTAHLAAFNRTIQSYKNYSAYRYVARVIKTDDKYNLQGIKFCNTVIGATRSNCTSSPYTQYYGDSSDCFWLCAAGYNDIECTKPADAENPSVCMSTGIIKKKVGNFGTNLVAYTPGSSIETEIPMVVRNSGHNCYNGSSASFRYSSVAQEHDLIIGIKEISQVAADGSSFKFRTAPLVVRAGGTGSSCWDKSQYLAIPLLYWDTASSVYLCPEGWGMDGNNCSPLESTACQLENLCDGFTKTEYDPDTHKIMRPTGKKCNEFRCESGAFTSETDHKCAPCPADGNGIKQLFYQGTDGMCKQCEIGKWPVKTGGKTSCNDAESFNNTNFLYGVQGAAHDDLKNQCWTKTNPSDFIYCVTGECPDGMYYDSQNEICKNCLDNQQWNETTKQCEAKPE